VRRRFALAMARRELRAAHRRLLLFGLSMALGVAGLVALQALRSAVREAVDARSQRLLGADLRLESRAPFEGPAGALLAAIEARAQAPAVHVTRFGSMALAPDSGRTRLVDVFGVDPGDPLYGAPETDPPGAWDALQADEPLALVDPSALVQLDAAPGQVLALGSVRFRILGTLRRTPGTVGLRTSVAPRVFVARRHAAATGLVQRGSLIEHQAYLRVAPEVLGPWLEANARALDAAHVYADTAEEVQGQASRGFASLARTLALVGLAALVLGGIGIAAGVRGWLFERIDGVAVLRSLGATFGDVLAAYGLAALVIGASAGLAGAALGTALQAALPSLLAGLLPVEVAFRPDPVAIVTGVGLGLWITLLFVAGPLFDLARVSPLRVLRRDLDAEPASRAGRAALLAALAASLVAAALWQAPTRRVGLGFAAGLGSALAALAGASAAASALLRRHRPRRAPFWLRQGLANLFRPRNHTLSTTLAIGLGVHLVATMHAVKHNVLAQLALDTRPDRPNLVIFDVQRDQLADLERFLAEREARVLERVPLVAARIARVGDRSAGDGLRAGKETARDLRWALGREYRLTWSAELRPSEQLVEGTWWQEAARAPGAPAPVSLEKGLAKTLGARLGDTIVWDVQGVLVPSVVASLRVVDWGRLATNFFAIFPPGVLEEAPRTSVLLLQVPGAEARAGLQRDLVAGFPNVAALDATLVLEALDAVLAQVGLAVRGLSLLTLATGLVILVAAAAASRHERTREALLLRTLGASGRLVRRVVATEAIALGALAVGVGTATALLASAGLVVLLFELPYRPPWGDLAWIALVAFLLTAVLGGWQGRPATRGSPLAGLREADVAGSGGPG
jgi:putative ABC transport system permease protein